MERINETLSVREAKQDIKTNTVNGMILGYTEEEIIVRHEDALYICHPLKGNAEQKIVTTTLNHYMKHHSLNSLVQTAIKKI